jgi:hypothetical protein
MPLFVIIAYIAVMGAVFTFRLMPEVYVEAFNDGVIAVVCLVGSYHLFRVYKRFESGDVARPSWMFFMIGLLGEGIGHVWYSTQEFMHGEVESFPNTADIFIMAGAICYVISFWKFKRNLKNVDLLNNVANIWLANAIFLILVILNCVFVIYPTISDPEEALWLRILYLYYPVFDTFLAYFCLHLALSFLSLGQSPVAKPWAVLVIAFMIFLVTDSAYAYFEVLGTYHPYMLINPGWGLAYLCVSHAAYLQYKLMSSMQDIKIDEHFWDDSDEEDDIDVFANL